MKYRRKINEVQAINLNNINNIDDFKNIQEFLNVPCLELNFSNINVPVLLLEDNNKKSIARLGHDYLIKSVDGKIYPVPKEVFEKVFEPVETTTMLSYQDEDEIDDDNIYAKEE